ncbi:RNA-binding motif protein, X-linked 2 isoform X3 [Drosophila santomea]|uniref:RNA-binding motif protein, X-linked 2 isoform X3 n=1 Tax=Drosophila santomea TaxID=129105 RepID=UPI0019548A64|nr:RNA-binding motif protein, X-linked 2 isoform X3 [Drosophila santomea]
MSRLPRPVATCHARGSGGHGHPVAGETHSKGQHGPENAERCDEADPTGISALHQGEQFQAPQLRWSSSSGHSDCELILAEQEEHMPRSRRHIRDDRKRDRSRSRGRSRGHSRGRSHGRSRSRSYTDSRRSRALPLALPVRISVSSSLSFWSTYSRKLVTFADEMLR